MFHKCNVCHEVFGSLKNNIIFLFLLFDLLLGIVIVMSFLYPPIHVAISDGLK